MKSTRMVVAVVVVLAVLIVSTVTLVDLRGRGKVSDFNITVQSSGTVRVTCNTGCLSQWSMESTCSTTDPTAVCTTSYNQIGQEFVAHPLPTQ
jgi:hypothetical protein